MAHKKDGGEIKRFKHKTERNTRHEKKKEKKDDTQNKKMQLDRTYEKELGHGNNANNKEHTKTKRNVKISH